MKNNTIKILVSVFVFMAFMGTTSVSKAFAVSSVNVLPASLTKNVGETFNVNVGITTPDTKVYAVEGKVIFNNLTCESIKVAEGLIAQSTPTCANPYFLVGIPSGTVKETVLINAVVKGATVGSATISFTNVDIIGEGKSVSTSSINGNYTISGSSLGGSYIVKNNTNINQNTSGSLIKTSSKIATGSQVATGGNKVATDKEVLDTDIVDKNNLVASAGMSVSNMSIIWILIAIILLLVSYIILRENHLSKNK